MRLTILFLLLFVLANLLLVFLHIRLFQSALPFAAWVSILLHVIALIFFPYTKLSRIK